MAYGTFLTRSRHRTNWYARIVIPHDLRDAYSQRREIRKTLHTPCKATARRRSMTLWLAYQQVFDSLRNNYLVSCLAPGWEAMASSPIASQFPVATAQSSPSLQLISPITHLVATLGIEGDSARSVWVSSITGSHIAPHAPLAAVSYAQQSRQLRPQPQSQYNSEQWADGFTGLQNPQPVAIELSQRLSVLFGQFVEERLSDAREKTVETMRQHLQVFIELEGDLSVSKLRKPVVRSFLQKLKSYPAHRNHGRWKDMSLDEIRAVGKKPISLTTQHNIVGNLSTFSEWLVEVDELTANPFKIKLKQKAKVPERNRTWTNRELSRWFHSDHVTKYSKSEHEAWKYWLPLVAIYTGARIEELASLSPNDFFVYDGIFAFKIHGEDGRFVKNSSSWRVVPVHSHLISLGFLDYVERRNGHDRLFTIEAYRGQYGKRASKAFGYIRKKLEIAPDFHGYRHTAIESLKLKGAAVVHIEWLVGHSGISMTGHYGSATDKRKWLPKLKEVVELLDWWDVIVPS